MRRRSTALAFTVVCVALSACSKQSWKPGAAPGPQGRAAATASAPATGAIATPAVALTPVATLVAQTTTQVSSSEDAQSASAAKPASAPRVEISDKTEGPFEVHGQAFTFVKHMQKIAGSRSADDSTVEWWELRDSTGKAAYRAQYNVNFQDRTFEESEEVDARELKTKFGQGILIDGESLPSAPGTGSWVQIFGWFNRKLVPFGAPISIEGGFRGEDVDTFQPSMMFRGQQPQTVSRDVLNFRLWTGNFNIDYAVAIDWILGSLRPASTCMQRTSSGASSACRYKAEAESSARNQETFVRLFSEPNPGLTPKHLVIKPESKVELVEAQVPISWNSDEHNISFGVQVSNHPSPAIWLHVKVDGQDGWISGEEDFEAVGLLPAG
jgi:hypothetical protein